MLGDLQCFLCQEPTTSTVVSWDGKPICSRCDSVIVHAREKNLILLEQVGWANALSNEAALLREAIRTGTIEEVGVRLSEIDHLNTVLQHSILVNRK